MDRLMECLPSKAPAFDINTDYSNVTFRMEHDYPAFCRFDVEAEFDGALRAGEYYIDSGFHIGHMRDPRGWKPHNLVRLAQKYIEPKDISTR
eukprot:gene4088-7970_t